MRAFSVLHDRLLTLQVSGLTRAREYRRRIEKSIKDEKGQTPTEYLMIVGLMAAVIVLVFVTFYFPQVREAANTWVAKVKTAILGDQIK